ncbi:hypothetical protein SAMN02745121_09156 [Nannocystis exedens]|uniref:Acyl dehydratase n=1 Tax=Nannocystis exedens TaxID=54 RepID=A0A1I2J6P5_9BACT|nr:hypothetical protein NAEX_09589 [Nannocystis exedens]PCC75778.1 hypothetical protein NAEX_08891 [Nannocystis exedens]SFF48897.1 hypothetical protein SAMN02745121_09156 [Nannocystis exedens]
MLAHDLGSLSVGTVLTTSTFTVKPADLTAHVESSFLGQVVGCGEEMLSTGSVSGGGAPEPWGRVCPLPVALGRALSALAHSEPFRDVALTLRSISRVRRFGEMLVGEPLTAIATVRFRSGRVPNATHVTLAVEVHRESQRGRVGATALSFEVGLELRSLAGASTETRIAGGAAAA